MRGRLRPPRPTLGAAFPLAVMLVALTTWRLSLPSTTFVVLAVGTAYLLARAFLGRRDAMFGANAAGAALLGGLLVLSVAGPRVAPVLVPAGFAYLLVGLGLAENAAVRETAARALRGRGIAPDDGETASSRDRAALGLVLPTCAVAVLLVPIASWTRPVDPGETAAPLSNGGDPSPSTSGAGDESATGGLSSERPDESRPAREDPGLVLLRATPTVHEMSTGWIGPLYLRGLPLVDVVGRRRQDMSRLRAVDDADDGRPDGWCELAPRPHLGDELDLDVRLELLEFAPTGEVIVFCPPATASVELPGVRADAGGAVVARREPGASRLDYRLVARIPSRVPRPRAETRVLGGDPRAARPSKPLPGVLEVAAFRATAESTNDLDRVRAVMRHLRANFVYEKIDGTFEPADGLAKFAAERHGTCLQFAEAAVVMLRTLGIPARIGRGFLLTEWDFDRDCYVGHARDAHAWVEVEFEGCGFVIFDPTPEASDDAPSESAAGVAPTPPPTPETPPPDVASPPIEGPDRLEQTVADVKALLERVLDWIAANAWICAALALVAAAAAVRTLHRRALRLSGAEVRAPTARGPWERLVVELARRGRRRRPSQTETEFAEAVVAVCGEGFRPLLELTARRQATRFGGRPSTAEDERAIDAFRAAVARARTT
jgi:transglutaminase-like putative cysteine protease